jgi:hemolysin activation/secretion protein
VVEGKVAEVKVTGNKHYSDEWIKGYFPDLKTGAPLFQPDVAKDLERANENPDHQVSFVLAPGKAPGTTNVELKVKDKFPWHARLEVNDKGTIHTPRDRTIGILQYTNLFDREQVLTFQYQTAPANPDQVRAFGGSYAIPIRRWGHTLTFYGAFSDSTTTFGVGGLGNVADFSTFGKGTVLGARYTFPLWNIARYEQKLTLGIDYKDLEQDLSVSSGPGAPVKRCIKTMVPGGDMAVNPGEQDQLFPPDVADLNDTKYAGHLLGCGDPRFNTKAAPAMGSTKTVLRTPVRYLPFMVGYNGIAVDKYGVTSVFANLNVNFAGTLPIQNFRKDFENRRPGSTGNWAYATLGISRTQRLWKNWTLFADLDGQRSSAPLIDSEQFAAGGADTVRGYPERAVLGDDGLHFTGEIRTPTITNILPDRLKGQLQFIGFYDAARVHTQVESAGTPSTLSLSSIGGGLRFSVKDKLFVKFDYGFPQGDVRNIPEIAKGTNGRVHFTVYTQF